MDNIDFTSLIGKTLKEASASLKYPWSIFPYLIDGKYSYKTDDFDIFRIHVKVEKELIVETNGVG